VTGEENPAPDPTAADAAPVRTDVVRYVAGLPKAELHVHLQGAASVPTVLELARRYPEVGVPLAEQALRSFYRFTDFAHFIEVYLRVNRLIRNPDDVRALVIGLGRDLAAVKVRYAEVTVTPDSHLLAGIDPEGLSEALNRGRSEVLDRHAVELAWVFDVSGDLGPQSADRTLDWVMAHRPGHSVGFGLGGPELGVPRPPFAEAFRRARDLGLSSVPHAGETTGPESVRDAVETLGAVRIGHGIAATRDPALLAELARRGIVLEVCPTSNLCTRAVADIAHHPLPQLLDAGARVTVNTDDPGMFDTDLNREYLLVHRVFGLGVDELTGLAREAVRASLAPPTTRQRLLAEIDTYATSWPATGQPSPPDF
jgi:aminodeoxyfutalosine deaminase